MVPALLIPGALALAEKFLPSLLSRVAGDKSGEAAKKVIDVAQAVTGLTTSEPAELQRAMDADPAAVLTFRTRCAEIEADLRKAELLDIQNARAMHAHSIFPALLSSFIVIGFYALIAYMAVYGLPRAIAGNESFLILIGSLAAAFGAVVQYWLGSSRQSQNKDNTISHLAGR